MFMKETAIFIQFCCIYLVTSEAGADKIGDDVCIKNPCLNGGVFEDFRCQCPPNFTGRACETNISLYNISPNPCLNGGTYIPDFKSCMCMTPYGGPNCDICEKFESDKRKYECEQDCKEEGKGCFPVDIFHIQYICMTSSEYANFLPGTMMQDSHEND